MVRLPIQTDIRFDDQIVKAITQAVDSFGVIDACINAASVVQRHNTWKTSMSTFDLINQINVRGSFMTSKFCLDYLVESSNPHILNICPPLDNFDLPDFKIHAYCVSKFDMSRIIRDGQGAKEVR